MRFVAGIQGDLKPGQRYKARIIPLEIDAIEGEPNDPDTIPLVSEFITGTTDDGALDRARALFGKRLVSLVVDDAEGKQVRAIWPEVQTALEPGEREVDGFVVATAQDNHSASISVYPFGRSGPAIRVQKSLRNRGPQQVTFLWVGANGVKFDQGAKFAKAMALAVRLGEDLNS